MRAIIALVLVGHAVMHVGAVACGLLSSSTAPWLVTDAGLDLGLVKTIAVLLTAIAAAGFTLGAVAFAGVIVPKTWWRPLIFCGSAASAILLAGLFSPAALPGLAIDAVLLWAVLRPSTEPAARLALSEGAGTMNVAGTPR